MSSSKSPKNSKATRVHSTKIVDSPVAATIDSSTMPSQFNKKDSGAPVTAKPLSEDKSTKPSKPESVPASTPALEEQVPSDAESDSGQDEISPAGPDTQLSAQEAKLVNVFRRTVKNVSGEPAAAKSAAVATAVSSKEASKPARGSRLELKEVYEAWDTKTFAYKLTEPSHSSNITELETYAFVCRVRILKKDEQRVYYVDIHATGLRDMLCEVLKDVHWVNLKVEKLELEQNLLYHYLPTLQKYLDKCTQDKTWPQVDREALRYLLCTMKTRTAETTARLQSLLETGRITYELLWALFPPNTLVLTMCPGSHQVRCLRFQFAYEDKTEQGVEHLALQCEYIDYDGKILGWVAEDLHLDRFHGTLPITSLPVYPIHYYPDPQIDQVLAHRGRRFIGLMGSHHCMYRGTAFLQIKDGYKRLTIQSNIMVDASEFSKTHPGYTRLTTRHVQVEYLFHQVTQSHRVIGRSLSPATLSDNELMMCPPTVLGCGLGLKFWGEFVVDHIHRIDWPSAPFDRVAIPRSIKTTLMSVTQQYFSSPHGEPAAMQEIGTVRRGIRILLHGPPGVGNTLTAQALACHYQRPLYPISSADLSSDPHELDTQLPQFFRAALAWNAVLLMDEADIFLQARTPTTLDRNRLVGIFLTRLEQFSGIMVLTTNRLDDIDLAILDRVLLKIVYHPLTSGARRDVLQSLLKTIPDITEEQMEGFDEAFLQRFTRIKANGRQITNVFEVATRLAEASGDAFHRHHLEGALEVSGLVLPGEDAEEDLYDD
ncbi:hypothetical protein LTR05_008568 [Lithohypha guttulata]|uniref:AAA+ ATPase domain-containing protein n=1 Tax=Lithohypha guttulata TaxID=1690604 RepID=A0AAN7ST74_9EURO|nr:hypothetical protein LTR05_008568 [Lithohypha guttulata]